MERQWLRWPRFVGGGDPGTGPALRDAEAGPALYRGHAGKRLVVLVG